MTGFSYGIANPTSQFGQTFPTISPHAFAMYGSGLQAQQYGLPLQQQSLQQLLQIVPQQLQQLLHIVPQQLQQVHNVQQQQLHYLQQLLQIVPQQLHQLQQLVQTLPQYFAQQPFQGAQQPFGAYQSPNVAGFGGAPWGLSATGFPHSFGYGAIPGQVM